MIAAPAPAEDDPTMCAADPADPTRLVARALAAPHAPAPVRFDPAATDALFFIYFSKLHPTHFRFFPFNRTISFTLITHCAITCARSIWHVELGFYSL